MRDLIGGVFREVIQVHRYCVHQREGGKLFHISNKACFNLFKNSGLRLIEVSRDNICDLPQIYDCIKNDILKYIIFIDGIKADENGVCKELKSVLGGQTEARKKNVLIYATAVSEDMQTASMFGINLNFSALTEEEYLNVIEDMLIDRGVSMTETIRSSAVSSRSETEGYSAAAAKQFVFEITGK